MQKKVTLALPFLLQVLEYTDYKLSVYVMINVCVKFQMILHVFLLIAILRRQKFTQLFAIHILTYVSILVHLSQYLWQLQH